jgi:ribosome-associated protein
MDDPLVIAANAAIPLEEVEIRASRSSGPGGQHANVTASRIEATVDLETCTGISEDQRRRLLERFGSRASATAQDTRSQARNRELALERLQARLAAALVVQPPRRPSRPSRAAVQKRLDQKRRQADIKRKRRPPDAD